MDQVGKTPGEPARRTSLSAPPILVTHEDIKHGEVTQPAASLNKIALKEILDKWSMKPDAETCQSPRSIKSGAKKKRPEVLQSIQCGQEREKMWLSDVFTRVGPLSRAMEQERKEQKQSIGKKYAIGFVNEKVKRIGPHLDIFEAFTHIQKVPRKDKMVPAAICIQKLIRGWLERTRLNRLRMKAMNHGPTLLAVVREYRKMMARIKRRCGILDLSTPLVFDQLENWLDQKQFYEIMFAKRVFFKELDQNELPKFFRDCGRFPSQNEINNTMKLVLKGSESKLVSINKTQAIEMAFMLYPPRGFKLATAAIARSTWLKPIIDGEDGSAYLTDGHPVLKTADIRVAGALVATSIRERKRKDHEINK